MLPQLPQGNNRETQSTETQVAQDQPNLNSPISMAAGMRETARRERAELTVIGSSGSHQPSADAPTGGGMFTQSLVRQLRVGMNLTDSVSSLVDHDINPHPGVKQIPVLSGDQISPELLSAAMQSHGVLVHVSGQVRTGEKSSRFLHDGTVLSDFVKDKQFEVIAAESLEEFRGAMAHAIKLGVPQPSSLIVHLSGHSLVIAPSSGSAKDHEAGASVTLPLVAHDPKCQGIFLFKGSEDYESYKGVHLVHESAIMGVIREARDSGAFKNIVVIFDTCHAGAFDAKQYLNDSEKSELAVDRSRIQPEPSR